MATSVKIAASSNGDNTIVSGVTGYAIRVLAYVLSFSSAATNAKWKSGSSTDLTGLIYGPLAAAAPQTITVPDAGLQTRGWFQTASGQDLVLNLSAANAVGGHVIYELVGQ